MLVNDALSKGFDSGNYANAYVSKDFAAAWEAEQEEEDGSYAEFESDEDAKRAFEAAFLIGFFGSYETHEIHDEDEQYSLLMAEHIYGPRMRALGINAAPRHAFVEPNPLEWPLVKEQTGINWRVVPKSPVGELPTFADFCAHCNLETGCYDCGMSKEDHGIEEERD